MERQAAERAEGQAGVQLPTVGFIGAGMMGRGLLQRALAAGHPVSVLVRHDRDRAALADLLGQGVRAAASPAGLAAACDVVVLCVTGAPQVEAIVFGPDGLVAGARAGLRVLDCSTSLPGTTRTCAQALAERGARFNDAAMTGTPPDAAAGTLNLLLGGSDDDLLPLEPLLRQWARNLYRCGGIGAGHSVKLLHQFVVLSNAAVLSEAYGLALRTGVDTRVLGDVIASGGANSTAFQRLRGYVEEGRDDGFRFTLANALKDMQYHAKMADAAGVDRAISLAALSVYIKVNEQGLAQAFVPHLLDGACRDNPLPLPSDR